MLLNISSPDTQFAQITSVYDELKQAEEARLSLSDSYLTEKATKACGRDNNQE